MPDQGKDILDRLTRVLLSSGAFTEEDVQQMVSNARDEALSELQDLLVAAHKEAFINQLKQEPSVGNADEAEDEQEPPTDLSSLTSLLRGERRKSEGSSEESDEPFGMGHRLSSQQYERKPQASTPSKRQVQPNGDGNSDGPYYVFGIVRSDYLEELQSEIKSISTFEGASPLELITSGSMSIIACSVPPETMNRAKISEKMHDPEWLEPHVQVHQRVQKQIMKHRTLIPMRFGTIFSARNRMHSFIKSHRQALYDSFNRLENTQEWGVKLFATSAATGTPQTENPAGEADFFEQEPSEPSEEEAQRRNLASKADYVHGSLSECAEEALINDPSNKLVSGSNTIEALNGVYLVDLDNLSHFHETLLSLQNDLEPLGFNLQLNGPWPPYHFVRLKTSAYISSPVK